MYDLKSHLFPTPVSIEDRNTKIKIADAAKAYFSFSAEGSGEIFEEASAYIKNTFCRKAAITAFDGNYEIKLCIDGGNEVFAKSGKKEAYFIDVSEEGTVICGCDQAGAYYGALTFADLLITESGEVYLAACRIVDYPRFEKRGHFMECRYGSDFMTLEEWKDAIDYLAQTKINTLVCGLYGCWDRQYDGEFAEYLYVPLTKYPRFKTPRNIKYYSAKEKSFIYKKDVLPTMFTEDYFGEMTAYAKKKNIEVIPLFNSLGHNTLIPRLMPEISAVDENGNYTSVGFCTNNHRTFEVMFDIYDEIIDKYLKPNGIESFEIGLDEVWPMIGINPDNLWEEREPFCKCAKCRGVEYGELMIEYIIRIAKHLKSKGMKNVYIYHDMLFNKKNMLDQKLADHFKSEGVYDAIVIDWWSYNPPGRNFRRRQEEVNGLFRSVGKPITGYFHWSVPTHMNSNIYAITEIAEKNSFEGIVAYGSFEYCYDFNYRVLAECAWNGTNAASCEELLRSYAYKLCPDNTDEALSALTAMQEITVGRYSGENFCANFFEYYTSSYLQRDTEYPQDYPAKRFRMIKDDEEKYLTYLQNTLAKAQAAFDFFDRKVSGAKAAIWKLAAAGYRDLCDEFLTVYTCAEKYNAGTIDTDNFVNELKRLTAQRDRTIALCEDVRIKANQYTCLRDMTISRQFVCDLQDYMQKELTSGKKPEVDIFSFGKYLSNTSKFLR